MTIQTTAITTQPVGVPQGFTLVSPEISRRMIVSVEGDWGTGKTDFALTAPGPIAFFKFDLNSDYTLSRYALKKKIYKREYDVVDPTDKNAQKKAEDIMQRFALDYAWCLQTPEIRTVIWDTATEIWEQIRLAFFGKLTNISPQHYVQVNNSFRAMIRAAFDSDTNLILIHRLKDEWMQVPDGKGGERGKKTGRKERAGFSDIGFAVQVMVQTFFTPENQESPFQIKVLKCTQNPLITHQVYGQIGDMRTNSFPCLATDVFPGTALSEWE